MDLIPLKVKIGLCDGRQHKFPSFNEIPAEYRNNEDWALYVDRFGGWHYDKVAGHDDDDIDSPTGTWIGMLLVPTDFAQEAVARWPDECSILDEISAQDFYEKRAHIHEPEIFVNTDVLQAIAAKRAAGLSEDQDDLNALNPDHPAPGRRRNKTKTWSGFKNQRGITIK